MKSSEQLKVLIDSIEDEPYQKIQKLRGNFQFPQFTFNFIRIQGSPGANPASIASIKVAINTCGIPKKKVTSSNQLALADFLIRRFNQSIIQFSQQNRGKDGSGSFHTVELSQKILERDCVLFLEKEIELRFIFSLPANESGGGLFDAKQTWLMFEQELSAIVKSTFFYAYYNEIEKSLLAEHLHVCAKRQEIERYMEKNGLLVFINNRAHLPRQSGLDDKPALGKEIQRFQSPKIAQVDIPLSDGTSIQGMAIKEGITCITGGGYHGKSTLLQAILSGVYAHIPDDGREFIVTREDAVSIRAEEGRSIKRVNISPFIGQLPNQIKTEHFCSDNASGSTSQAANIVEAMECGSRFLLFDEDTCATNFLFRDKLIDKVLDVANEPIKPLYSTMRSLWKQHRVSMIFVIGGLGHFLQKAETCLLMDNYQCKEISSSVRSSLGEIIEDKNRLLSFTNNRYLMANNFDPSYINHRLKKKLPQRIKDLRNAPKQLEYGMDLINLEALPQLVEAPQMLSIGYCLLTIRKAMQQHSGEEKTMGYWLTWLYNNIEQKGLSFLQPDYSGTLSLPRKYEVAAAINRIRSLNIFCN